MKRFLKFLVAVISLSVVLIGCSKSKASEAEITTVDKVSLDFFPDGRLHIQGPDGEATMWQGKWSLAGNLLTMERTDLEKTETVEVKIEGENLILGNTTYTRSAP